MQLDWNMLHLELMEATEEMKIMEVMEAAKAVEKIAVGNAMEKNMQTLLSINEISI